MMDLTSDHQAVQPDQLGASHTLSSLLPNKLGVLLSLAMDFEGTMMI